MIEFNVGVRLIAVDAFEITIVGDVDLSNRDTVRELIDACIETGARSIRFDMRDVTLCGSDCVFLLVHAVRSQVRVSVVPSGHVLRTLEITGVEGLGIIVEHP